MSVEITITGNRVSVSEYTTEMSKAQTHMLDNMLYKAIRAGANSSEEADILIEHLHNTIDDAESYFGSNGEDRAETMYSGDFNYRNEYL